MYNLTDISQIPGGSRHRIMVVDPTSNFLVENIQKAQSFIADEITGAGNFVAKNVQATARFACRKLSAADSAFGDFSPGALQAMSDACQGYLDGNGWSRPVLEPPFTGGQCPGVQYRVVIGTSSTSNAAVTVVGPVEALEFRKTTQYYSYAEYNWYVVFAGGQETICRDVDFGNFSVSNSLGQAGVDAARENTSQYISVTRPDGLPDDCGSPPPNLKPGPTPAPDPGPWPPGYEPKKDPSGIPRIPIPPIVYSPSINIDLPDFVFGSPNGSGTSEPSPGDRGQPGSSTESSAGEVSGEAPAGKYLEGVLVELVTAAQFVNKSSGPGFTVYRGACYVFLGGDAGVDLQPEGSTCIFPQFFEAPYNSTKWRVCVNVGYTLRVTPYYRSQEAQEI